MSKIGLLMITLFLSVFCSCGTPSATEGTTTRPENIITVNNIYVDCVPPYGSNEYFHEIPTFTINVDLMPGSLAVAGTVYSINLYESGGYRGNALVSWTSAQLNASFVQSVKFPSSEQEYNNYFSKDLSSIFAIDINVSTAIYIPAT